jgi:subtilisin family serine protease
VSGGYDFVNNDPDPRDDNGHGTHVAGIIGANGPGVVGVAPGVRFHAYKVLAATGFGSSSDVIAAIDRSLDPDQDPLTDDAVDVINLSLGSSGDANSPTSQAVDAAVRAGVVVAVAAGNGSHYFRVNAPGASRPCDHGGCIHQGRHGRVVLVARPGAARLRHQARRRGAGRRDPLVLAGRRNPGAERNLDGDAARGRGRGVDARAPSRMDARDHQGTHDEHGGRPRSRAVRGRRRTDRRARGRDHAPRGVAGKPVVRVGAFLLRRCGQRTTRSRSATRARRR